MQGIPAGFSLTAISSFLAAQHVDSAVIGSFIAVSGIPWTFQFVWGPLIDRFQYSTMGHRKHWLVLAQLLAFLASLLLITVTDPVHQLVRLGAVFFLHSLFASVQDASADAMIIDIVPPEERGRANAFMRGGFLAGIAVGAAGLSVALHAFGFTFAAAIQSLLLLLFTVVTFMIRLRPGDELIPSLKGRARAFTDVAQPPLKTVFRKIFQGIGQRRNLLYFLLIAAVYCCCSVFIRSFTFSLIQTHGWSDRSLSVLQGGWGTALMLIVVLAGGTLADKFGAIRMQKRVMLVIGSFLVIFSLLGSYWGNPVIATTGLVVWNFADPLFSVACFPVLMALCVKPVEGSQFTTYMAVINLCDVVGSYLTGWALHVTQAHYLALACGIIILVLWLIFRQLSAKYAYAG